MKDHAYIVSRIVALLLSCLFIVSVYPKTNKIDVIRSSVDSIKIAGLEGIPVAPFKDTLFYIQTNIGSFSAQERAASIEHKIKTISGDLLFNEDSLSIVSLAGISNIMYKNEVVIGVDTIQAIITSQSKLELANTYINLISNAIREEKANISWKTITLHVLGSIAIILAEYFLIKLVLWGHRHIRVYVRLQRGKKIKKMFQVIEADHIIFVALAMLRLVRFLIIIIILYIGLLALFALSPYTEHLSDTLLRYVMTPLKVFATSFIEYIPKLLVILLIFRYIRKVISFIFQKLADGTLVLKGFYSEWAKPTNNIVSTFLFIFMFIRIFPYLPSFDSAVFQGVSVFAGIMLSLGSNTIIGNLIAGLVITYMRPFKLGDRIKIGDVTGDVFEKTALVTRIKTTKNEIITFPNSTVMSSQTTNYTHSAKAHGLILYTSVSVGYQIPWSKVNDMLLEAANRTFTKKTKTFYSTK